MLDEFLEPMRCSREELAHELGWAQKQLGELIAGELGIDPDMADDLARVLGTNRYLWLQLQARYSTWLAEQRRDRPYKMAA